MFAVVALQTGAPECRVGGPWIDEFEGCQKHFAVPVSKRRSHMHGELEGISVQQGHYMQPCCADAGSNNGSKIQSCSAASAEWEGDSHAASSTFSGVTCLRH